MSPERRDKRQMLQRDGDLQTGLSSQRTLKPFAGGNPRGIDISLCDTVRGAIIIVHCQLLRVFAPLVKLLGLFDKAQRFCSAALL